MRILLCLYTCDADADALGTLEATPFLKHARCSPGIEVVTITANPAPGEARSEPTRIVVPCAEDYRWLSVKTHLMIQAALARPFDFLLKVDSTLATYAARPHAKSAEMLSKLSPSAAAAALRNPYFFAKPYNGLVQQVATRTGFEGWASVKEISGDFTRVFPNGVSTPPYYLGKLYSLRRDFCRFIADHGAEMASQHQAWLGGAEDLMIGRLYQQWQHTNTGLSGLIRRAVSRLRLRAGNL